MHVRRVLNCPRCCVVGARNARAPWTPTGEWSLGGVFGRVESRVQVELLCLECATTWWSGNAAAVAEFERLYGPPPIAGQAPRRGRLGITVRPRRSRAAR